MKIIDLIAEESGVSPNSKRCTICLETKSFDNFYKSNYKKDGLVSQCKSCSGKAHKKYVEKNKSIIKSKQKEYYELNKEITLEKQKVYYCKNKLKINERRKEHYYKHREDANKRAALFYYKDKEHVKSNVRKWQKKNPDKKKAYSLASYYKNIHKYKEYRKENLEKNSLRKIKQKENLEDTYIVGLLKNIHDIPASTIRKNPDLIVLKRYELAIKRYTNK